jgi:DNA-binding transcriptional LysR family regulator
MKNEFRSWSDVRVFLAVIRQGSTLAASRTLGVAQPTVARRIEALEHETGVTLFDRDTRGFRPTETACALVPLAEAMEQAAADFATTVKDLTTIRPIRITAYAGNFSPRANAIFSEFLTHHPNVRFELVPAVNVLDLMAGEADIALRLTKATPDPELICRKISTARFTLYGSHGYAEKHGLPDSPDALRNHCFVTYERDDVPPVLHNWLLQYVSPDQIILSFGELDLMYAAIKAGQGLGVINVKMAESDSDLIRCFEPPEEMSSEHLMLISPEAYRRPEIKAFTKFFAPRYAAIFK